MDVQRAEGMGGPGDAVLDAEHELDRRLFHLKTLYDVSAEILGKLDFRQILRSFLLMSTGNFGVLEAFVVLADAASGEAIHFDSVGYSEEECASVLRAATASLRPGASAQAAATIPGIECALPIALEPGMVGMAAMGAKLVGEPFDDGDQELLRTLVNNLVVALRNAGSYQHILHLNDELSSKNLELQAALRKVVILESVKSSLSKFVPATVCSLIDKSPTGSMPESEERDVSVLFLDIQGYTRLCEMLDPVRLNQLVEKCFSVFMEAIYANGGDVNETAGDGLMVLFHSGDHVADARNAVRTATTIREKAARVQEEWRDLPQPLAINMGINSGTALLGAAKFESYTGSRWTYTARGSVTNVAARLGGYANDGRILLSRVTAERVRDIHALKPLGALALKNVSQGVEAFEL